MGTILVPAKRIAQIKSEEREEIMKTEQLAEFVGNYGPIAIPEKLVQRIWLEKSMGIRGMDTTSGLPIRVLNPGQWNSQAGPDFLNAHLVIDGKHVYGDVEIHFHQQDWFHHGHQYDERYANVVLHVILFPTKANHVSTAVGPKQYFPQHQLVLLNYLSEDLESTAEDDYLEQAIRLPSGTVPPQGWASLSPRERREHLIQHALIRFYSLAHRVHKRCQAVGNHEACHQIAMEILGIPGNREVFLKLAEHYPISLFRKASFDQLWQEIRPNCSQRATRPANHPKRRLQFYHNLVQRFPDWPERLFQLRLPDQSMPILHFALAGEISAFRKMVKLSSFSQYLQQQSGWALLGAGKWNTLVANLILPILHQSCPEQSATWWFAWPSANRPDSYGLWLKTWEITQLNHFPHCNGWDQGAIALFRQTLERNFAPVTTN